MITCNRIYSWILTNDIYSFDFIFSALCIEIPFSTNHLYKVYVDKLMAFLKFLNANYNFSSDCTLRKYLNSKNANF
jgi:hypothetical protein